MSTATNTGSAPHAPAAKSETRVGQILTSPWLWGPVCAALVYAFIQHLPQSEFVTRSPSQRGVLYVEAVLFFVGLGTLLRKAAGSGQERRALKLVVIDAGSLHGIALPAERAGALLAATAEVPAAVGRTKLVTRIRAACRYVADRDSASSLEEHLRYLADLAVEDQSASFALTRTITWSLPVLGGLGGLLGLAEICGAVDPANLSASIPQLATGLTSGLLAIALSLCLSISLLLATHAVERSESRILARIEQFGIGPLAVCLGPGTAEQPVSLLVAAEEQAAAQLIERTESLINRQTGLWQAALEEIRGRWLETCHVQQSQFSAALEQGTAAGLASHVKQLDEARAEFLNAFRAVGLELSRVTAGLQQMGEEHQELFHKQVSEIWQAMQAQMAAAREDHQTNMQQSLKLLDAAVRGWRKDLGEATAAVTAQVEELRRRGEMIGELAGQEGELIRLQATLADNLQSVRAIEAFEQSIHSLNAAVHMLTIRAKAHAA